MKQYVNEASHYPGSVDLPVSVQGAISAPGQRMYQIWYRDSANDCTTAMFNLSNALVINWTPLRALAEERMVDRTSSWTAARGAGSTAQCLTRLFDSLPAHIVATAREGAWAPVLVFGLHIIASRVYGWYGPYPDLDIPMHFAGGVAIAWFIHRAAVNAARARWLAPFHTVTHVLLVMALTGSSTVVWEFAEYFSDRYLGTHAQAGLPDTLLDMALGCCGGIALVMAISWRARARSISIEQIGAGRALAADSPPPN